jgi:hypothetical protein
MGASVRPTIKTKPGKHSHIALVVDATGPNFKPSVAQVSVVDNGNTLTFGTKIISCTDTKMKIELTAPARPAGIRGGLDAGTLSITVTNTDGSAAPMVSDTPVDYVDDFT